jgi:hypothetical protein
MRWLAVLGLMAVVGSSGGVPTAHGADVCDVSWTGRSPYYVYCTGPNGSYSYWLDAEPPRAPQQQQYYAYPTPTPYVPQSYFDPGYNPYSSVQSSQPSNRTYYSAPTNGLSCPTGYTLYWSQDSYGWYAVCL